MTTQQDTQQKLIELQIINKQIENLKQQLSNLQLQEQELIQLQLSLEEIEKTKIGTKILTSLSVGVLIETELKNNKEVIAAVGSNTTIRKTIQETKKTIQYQKKQLELVLIQLQKEIQQYFNASLQLEKEISEESSKQ